MDPLLRSPEDIHVLHVDDDPQLLDLVATFLERERDDLVVSSESDPTAVTDRLARQRVDCIVSDHDMPQKTGLELLATVRETHPDVPFVLFTGKGSEAIAAKAIDAGVDAYIRKESGTAQYAVLAQRIVTAAEQYHADRRAAKAREVYELLARVATDAFWVRDMETGETHYSEGIRQFGYDPGLRADGFEWWLERVHPDDRDRASSLNIAQERGHPAGFDHQGDRYGRFAFVYRWRKADDSYVDTLSRGVVRFENDEAVEMVGAMTDVAARSDTATRDPEDG